jgi:hypothetical protein
MTAGEDVSRSLYFVLPPTFKTARVMPAMSPSPAQRVTRSFLLCTGRGAGGLGTVSRSAPDASAGDVKNTTETEGDPSLPVGVANAPKAVRLRAGNLAPVQAPRTTIHSLPSSH